MFEQAPSLHQSNVQNFSEPCVRDLTYQVQPISIDAYILDVLHLFQDQSTLSALPILDAHNRYFGIISRKNYLNLMTRAFARELFARKKLSFLLTSHGHIFIAPLIVEANDRIDQVIVKFLTIDPNFTHEAIPVIDQHDLLGLVKIADLILRMSQSQGSLIETMVKLSARLNDEVESAATLQKNLLRPARIELPGLQGQATMLTSSEVGGDFYDYYVVDARWIIILVGDVSGHGIAAGTIVCAAKAGVNFLESEQEKAPHLILARLNQIIFKTAHQSLLMTMFAVCIDSQTGELQYANAGHQFAYIYRSILSQLDSLELGGLPLGKNEHTQYEHASTEIDIGDRLFLYTDSIVEEENTDGECFGYDRLEAALIELCDNDIHSLNTDLLHLLTQFLGRTVFYDDVTLFSIEHLERTLERTPHLTLSTTELSETNSDSSKLTIFTDSYFRDTQPTISADLQRQVVILLAEHDFSDLIPSLAQQGIRRVLMPSHPVHQHLNIATLRNQHLTPQRDDLVSLLRHPDQRREFQLTHTEDKYFILNEIQAWLEEQPLPYPDRIDTVIFLLDELIENGVCAAPRDGKGRALYPKGQPRELADDEILTLDLSLQNGLLGISLLDNWGTLTPKVFLTRLSLHIQGQGLEAGVGGGGLYLIWRMSDYLQIRVFPHQQTQVCAFIDFNTPFEPNADKSYQFLYHNEFYEVLDNA